ncbi:helix-turn-helix domain-containing protein [Methylobacterium sp. WL122]|nr:helix-turn-helix domain-containing protein [Methylobacterium sp. WL122]
MDFKDATDYFRAYAADPAACAIFPLQMIADLRNVSRGAIVGMIDTGKLKEIKIGKVRYVRASSYIDLLKEQERRDQQVLKFLTEAAARREVVTYEPVMSLVGLRWQTPADRNTVGAILGRISEDTFKKHGVLLSVIVHRKTPGKTRPGKGFFELAEYLGYDWEDEDTFIDEETEKLWDFYANKKN